MEFLQKNLGTIEETRKTLKDHEENLLKLSALEQLAKEISAFHNIKLRGLMTMGPRFGNPEDSRPYFVETKKVFERIKKLNLPDIEMRYLSMGMTNSYKIAIEEGANIVRIGTKLFGERDYLKKNENS